MSSIRTKQPALSNVDISSTVISVLGGLFDPIGHHFTITVVGLVSSSATSPVESLRHNCSTSRDSPAIGLRLSRQKLTTVHKALTILPSTRLKGQRPPPSGVAPVRPCRNRRSPRRSLCFVDGGPSIRKGERNCGFSDKNVAMIRAMIPVALSSGRPGWRLWTRVVHH